MSSDFWKEIIKHLQHPNRPFLGTVLAITGLFALSPAIRSALGIESFYSQFQYIFSLLLLYSLFFLGFDCFNFVWERVKVRLDVKNQKEYMIQTLQDLSLRERELMSFFFSYPSDVVWLPVEDASVISLLSKRIFYQAQNYTALKMRRDYSLKSDQCWACTMTPATRKLITESFSDLLKTPVSAANRRQWEYVQEA